MKLPAYTNVKQQCVAVITAAGYDFITACGLYEDIKTRFLADPATRKTYHIEGGGSFTLQKGAHK